MKMKKLMAALLTVTLLAAVFAGCGSNNAGNGGNTNPPENNNENQNPPQSEPVTLQVFAAASLTESMNAIAENYKSVAPNVTLEFNFDSSGKLQDQIENGADADVFISAAQKQMTGLIEGGYVEESAKEDLLINKVVLIVPEGSDKDITSFEDCGTDKVGLMALGNADVPVGQYSEEIFKNLSLWDGLQSKISFGGNVKEVLSQVESGAVDCGVVYATDAATATGIKVVCEAPEGSHQKVVYPAAPLKESKNAEAAKAFLAYLKTDAAVKEFETVGFSMAQ